MAELGLAHVGQHGERGLRYLDAESRGDAARKATCAGKIRRKQNRRKRTAETKTAEDGAYGPQTARDEVVALKEMPAPDAP